MTADAPDSTPNPGSWGGAITSPDTFLRAVEDGLYEARRLADATPGAWIYQSIAGVLEGILPLAARGRRPERSERANFESMLPIIRSQAGDADPALIQLVDSVVAYLMEWPFGHERKESDDEDEAAADGGVNEPAIPSLDALVAAIHQARGELEESEKDIRERAQTGSLMGRAMLDAQRSAGKELEKMLAAIAAWARSAQAPASGAVKTAPGMQSWRQLVRYLPVHASRLRRIRRSYEAWRRRAAKPEDHLEVSSFEQLVPALSQGTKEAAVLLEAAPDHKAVKEIGDRLDWMLTRTRDWITDLTPPDDRQPPLANVLSQDLDLLEWPQLPRVQKGVRELVQMLAAWPPESTAYFQRQLHETAIDLELLRTVSASRALDDVARRFVQLLYYSKSGKEPAPHERREVNLRESITRELDIYASPVLPAFLARVRAIDAFWPQWMASHLTDISDAQPPPVITQGQMPTRHEVERATLIEIESCGDAWAEPAETTRLAGTTAVADFTRSYFYHMLETTARDFSGLPMAFPFSRALGLQLRAIRRLTDGGRAPTAEQRRAIGSAFAAIRRGILANGGVAPSREVREAFSLHAYFQAWPPDDNSKKWSAVPEGMISGEDHFAETVAGLVADAGCLLVLWPNHGGWIDVFRQSQRMNQCAEFGRVLDAAQRQEVDRVLGSLPAIPSDALANVPRFSEDFPERVRQAREYFSGRRVNSWAAFDEMLRLALEESRQIQVSANWAEDEAPLAAIDRQLRAMGRWTAGGRAPTRQECEATQEVLATVSRLRGLDRMTEWAKRIAELSSAFQLALAEESDSATVAPAAIASEKDFALLLEDTHRDCRSVSGRKLMVNPAGPQMFWDELAKNLAPIKRMIEQGRVPTQRERAEIHRALTGVDISIPNPCPAIHDFLDDMSDRLRRIDAYYAWLVTAGRFAGKETASVDTTSLRCMTLGGEMRIAFARTVGTDPGIYVCAAEKTSTTERTGVVEFVFMRYQPTIKNLIRLVACEGWAPAEIQWNAHSDFLAYLVPGRTPQVGWCETRSAGEKGRVNAAAFAWATKGSSMICVDPAARTVFRLSADTGATTPLAPLPEDITTAVKPQIAVSPSGNALALTYGRKGGTMDLALLGFEGARPVMRVRMQFTGASAVLPFWSNGGDIGCLAVTKTGSDILSIPFQDGNAEVLYHSDLPQGIIAPAWSTTGKYIAFFQPQRQGAGSLALLDCDSREVIPLLESDVARGRLSFGEETVCVQGEDSALILWPKVSHRRSPMERF